MDQFNFSSFPETNFNETNLSWILAVMATFKEDLESGQFVGPPGPPGPKGDPGPAGDGLSENVKQALLQLARKVAYVDDQGLVYYQDLYNALYNVTPTELVSISAAYTQTGTVYDTDSLESLKADLIVTATYSDSSTAVIPAADYTLSGSLIVGTSTITVSYSGKTATFEVSVTASAVTLVSISAAFNQGSAVIYESDSLDSLKQYLTVTATYSDSTTAPIPSTDYTLSGTMSEGTSTITVSYRGKTDTFQVTVTADPVPVTLVSISAAFNQGSAVIYDSDSLDSLKQYLVVTATYSDSTTATIPSADYTLSGTLTAGTSTITVSYQGKTDTFQVAVTASILYQVSNHSVDKTQGIIDTELQLLSTDRDFSILFDGIQTAAVPTGAAVRQFLCADSSSSWKGIFCGASSSATQYALQWCNSSTVNVGLRRNAVNTRVRISYVHVSGSDQVTVKTKVNDGSIATNSLSSAFIAQDAHLYIGGANTDNSTNWIGTITSCKVYGIAVDSTTLSEFFA